MASLYTHQLHNVFKTWLFLSLFFFASPATFAQEIPDALKTYEYDSINIGIDIKKDSTFDVAEKQTYDFHGHFHKGWRSVPLKGIGEITDIRVVDETGKKLVYSSAALDKNDPASWGTYHYEFSNGALNIEWYYNATDTKRTWTIYYTVHGGLSFLKDHDELYWNLFTDYDVPVRRVDATVILPEPAPDASKLQSTLYALHTYDFYNEYTSERIGNDTFHFAIAPAAAKENVTIAAGWPKGLVAESAYWKDFVKTHIAGFIAALAVLLSLIIAFVFWYRTEIWGKGRGTIVPEYAPPRDLPPAMAEALVKEGITVKAWPATIVDLAVRGYIEIAEEDAGALARFGRIVAVVLPLIFVALFVWLMRDIGSAGPLIALAIFVIVIFRLAFAGSRAGNFFSPKEYVLTKKRDYEHAADLQDYERTFLRVILGNDGRFSTKEVKKSVARKRALFEAMKRLKESVYEELEDDQKDVYDVGISEEKKRVWVIVLLIVGVVALFKLFGNGYVVRGDLVIPAVVIGICIAALYAFMRYEARLSKEGAILREEWLGFKLYLETAERDRLQNLTPDLFEKYLPYAIIFGVEKKWAKAFDTLNLPPPSWYHGSAVGLGTSPSGGISAGGFTASAFSASFASSLSSAFSSAGGGGGASGGGGGAGGGGGGGGGGAS